MKEPLYCVLLITTPTIEEAQRIAKALLESRQAACVNIVSPVQSLFWWQGKIDSASEALLIVKTRSSKLSEIIKSVKAMHSYTVPEVIALPIIGGNEDYLKWLDKETED